MKYKITKTEIKEDPDLFGNKSLSELKSILFRDIAYISRVRSGKRIVSENVYRDMKERLDKSGQGE